MSRKSVPVANTRVTPDLKVRTIKQHNGVNSDLDLSRVIQSEAFEYEDAFLSYTVDHGGHCLPPTYDLTRLESLVQSNNVLANCIDAMIANVDGTGYDIIPAGELESGRRRGDGDHQEFTNREAADEQIRKVEQFFEETWPGQSFSTLRRQLRRDQEVTGNAYIEVLRNPAGKMMFLRRIAPAEIRLCKLCDPVETNVRLDRDGQEISVRVGLRYRRYAQVLAEKLVYFKEFGVDADLHKGTGDWAKEGNRLPANDRATEIIHLKMKDDPVSGYGLPRWINQIPSVIGSRRAEEHNLEFFHSGGVPPVLIAVSGGELAPEAVERLEQLMSSESKNKTRAAVIEAFSSDGTLESSSNVKLQVERFGSEQQQDSMFENYDKRCEERIRSAFRLPSMFVGRSDDMNFATAFASYQVAEAQVFHTERAEFDEVVNTKIMPEIGGKGLVFRSRPLAVKNSEVQMAALEMATASKAISNEQLIDALNEVSNLQLKLMEGVEEEPAGPPELDPDKALVPDLELDRDGSPLGVRPENAKKSDEYFIAQKGADFLVKLADEAATCLELGRRCDPKRLHAVTRQIESLNEIDKGTVNQMLSMRTMFDTWQDPKGTADLAGCALAILSATIED
jgi:PBSX family phage portal protein